MRSRKRASSASGLGACRRGARDYPTPLQARRWPGSSPARDVPPPRVSTPGLPFSSTNSLQGHLAQRQIHPAVLLLPAVIRCRADRQGLADLFDLPAPANSMAAWWSSATIRSGLCRVRFTASEFRAALRAAPALITSRTVYADQAIGADPGPGSNDSVFIQKMLHPANMAVALDNMR